MIFCFSMQVGSISEYASTGNSNDYTSTTSKSKNDYNLYAQAEEDRKRKGGRNAEMDWGRQSAPPHRRRLQAQLALTTNMWGWIRVSFVLNSSWWQRQDPRCFAAKIDA